MICLILSPSQNCCHSHCVNKSMARVKCEKQEINYAPCGTTPPRKEQTQGPTKSCTLPCCQKEQLPCWTLHPWLARLGLGSSAISALSWGQGQGPPCTCKAGARGLLDTPAAPLTQTGTQKLCGDKAGIELFSG